MGFLGIYRALYDYIPSGEGEIAISDGDLLFVLDKGEDDWWKVKKKAVGEDEEEPEGLIPANYVEEVQPLGQAKALYDYARQTDEELSFSEDAMLNVYDTSDPDWTLVGAKGEYGFAPANYIDTAEEAPPTPARARPVPREPEPEPEEPPTPESSPSPQQNPAAALAGIIAQRTGGGAGGIASRRPVSPPPAMALPARPTQYTPEESEEEAPAPRLPQRPPSETTSPPVRNVRFQSPTSPSAPSSSLASPPYNRHISMREEQAEPLHSPGGYHIYNIYEMVEVLGKSKKMPVTLGINIAKGIIMISAEKERSQKEWTADKLTHYSIEGKHVFMELVRPSKSIDFHAGAKDTAHEIVSALGELAGAARVEEGLKEVFEASAGSTLKKGKMIYEFMAQGDDEVTVAEGDEVIILDDTKSDEWWMVRRIKNGKEGVVPNTYVDIIGTVPAPAAIASPITSPTAGTSTRSYVEQNRLEEERLAKQAAKRRPDSSASAAEGASGLQLPKRHSSLMAPTDEPKRSRDKRASKDAKSEKKALPNRSKVRTWTDRSGSFKVEAEFLGLRDEKIHLHKLNGVKIAVPVPKMSMEDLEFVERATGISLDDLKPLSDIKRRNSKRTASAGATVQKIPQHDWFEFFLSSGVDPQICERYSQAFNRDNIGEENLDDVTPQLLRTLGFKEGDILRVMKALDTKFNRKRQVSLETEAANGSLFSGPGGALKNNTAKGRPVPPSETKNELDPSLLKQGTGGDDKKATPLTNAPTPDKKATNGFDDNAWEPRASRTTTTASPPPTTTSVSPPPAQPAITPGIADLSLLSAPLQPTPAPQPAPQPQIAPPVVTPPPQPPQPTGASPSLFEQLANAPPGQPKQRPNQPQVAQNPAVNSLIAPPPGRSASAPQNPNQLGGFQPPPLQPQLTGYNVPLRMQTTAAPPGQSLSDIAQQQRLFQQQNAFLQAQQTGFGGNPGFNQFQQNGLMPQATGYAGQFGQNQPGGFGGFQPQATGYQNPSFQQAIINGQQNGSPFADPPRAPFQPQATGFGPQGFSPSALQPQATGVNAFLPPALQPQATGITANQFGNQSFVPPPVPPIPSHQQAPAPLIPQKTGPPPPVRFGVAGAQRLVPQPTGRANLSKATAQNPFGF